MIRGFLIILLLIIGLTHGLCQECKEKTEYQIYSKAIAEYLKDYSQIDTITTLVIKQKKQTNNIDCQFAKDYKDSVKYLFAINRDLIIIDSLRYKNALQNKIYEIDSFGHVDNLLLELTCRLDSLNNIHVGKVKNEFDLNYKVKLISDRRIKCIFRNRKKNGWDKFYKIYPKSFGIMELSNIAFTKNKKYCLFYFGYRRYSLSGYGCLMLLDLERKENLILKLIQLWIS